MIDSLNYLWPILEAPDPTVGAHTIVRWPQGVGKGLIDIGLLRRTDRAQRVRCPECQNHYEEVLALDGPGGTKRFYIPCPEVLRAEIDPSLLDQWMASSERLFAMLAKTLSLQGKCVALISSRLWRLGRTQWQGSLRDVLFTRGLHWSDAETVRSEIVRAKKPIIFVPKVQPQDSFWKTPPGSQFKTLRDIISLDDQTRRTGASQSTDVERFVHTDDVHTAIASLPPQLQEFCKSLQLHGCTETRSLLGLSRRGFDAALESIREHFLQNSLAEKGK